LNKAQLNVTKIIHGDFPPILELFFDALTKKATFSWLFYVCKAATIAARTT